MQCCRRYIEQGESTKIFSMKNIIIFLLIIKEFLPLLYKRQNSFTSPAPSITKLIFFEENIARISYFLWCLRLGQCEITKHMLREPIKDIVISEHMLGEPIKDTETDTRIDDRSLTNSICICGSSEHLLLLQFQFPPSTPSCS